MLALVGSGEYLPPIEPVDQELIHRLSEPVHVVCLPTAAGTEGPARINYWSRLGVEHFTRLGVQVEAVPVTDHASANDPALARVVAEANYVYLSGGKPGYLYESLKDTLIWQSIQSVLASGGLLAGCSAGAMIMGEKIYAFPGIKPGFDFLHGALIMPHFDEISASMLYAVRQVISKSLTLIGIDGNTALVKDGDQYEVLGSGGVTIWDQSGKTRYMQGKLPLLEFSPGGQVL